MPKIPDFRPLHVGEMRALWRQHPDVGPRRLLLEIHHLRGVLVEI